MMTPGGGGTYDVGFRSWPTVAQLSPFPLIQEITRFEMKLQEKNVIKVIEVISCYGLAISKPKNSFWISDSWEGFPMFSHW